MSLFFSRRTGGLALVIGLALATAGCATTSGRGTPADSMAADCMVNAAMRLDNGVSPAHVIGRRVLNACRGAIRASAHSDARSREHGEYVYRRLMASNLGTYAVRTLRSSGLTSQASLTDMQARFDREIGRALP